jgi:hypothetical protein
VKSRNRYNINIVPAREALTHKIDSETNIAYNYPLNYFQSFQSHSNANDRTVGQESLISRRSPNAQACNDCVTCDAPMEYYDLYSDIGPFQSAVKHLGYRILKRYLF